MRYYLRHKSLAAILAGAMVVLFAVGIVVYRARAQTLAALRAEVTQKKTQLAGAKARIKKRGQLEQEYSELRARLAVLEPTLPTYAYVPTFLKQIEALALDTDNVVGGVRPVPRALAAAPAPPPAGDKKPGANGGQAPQPAEQAYDRLPIEVSLTGGYWDTAKFLSDLAAFPKLIAVSDMQFTPTSGSLCTAAPDLQVKLNLLALIYKGGEEESWTSDAKNSSS